MKQYKGIIADVFQSKFYKGIIYVEKDKITKIEKVEHDCNDYILPGLIDSHVHIESSMSTPSAFAVEAVKHGTVAAVCDPHEIANVLGVKGVEYMINNGKQTPFKFFFGASSCVPATDFETAGAKLNSNDIDKLLQRDDIYFLSEMMNYPGVIFNDEEVHAKINFAKKYNKPIDGHIPGIKGDDLKKYISAGISTDHECFTIDEALEKIKLGMKIQIRQGSAAKNFENLFPLIDSHNASVMLCTDDSHPEELLKWHIDKFFHKAKDKKIDFFNLLRAATLNPVKHYNLNVGLLQEGDPADFIIIDDFQNFRIKATIINGEDIYSENSINFKISKSGEINNFHAEKISLVDLEIKSEKPYQYIIDVIDGELITKVKNIKIPSDLNLYKAQNLNKIIVQNRYQKSKPSVGLISNFNIKNGAIASSIAHDSHNIVAVGSDDEFIALAVNKLIDNKGGIVVCKEGELYDLKLEIGGIMTENDMKQTANQYLELDKIAKEIGCNLSAPFMTLSFMSLPVIPEIKITDKGLFDVVKFQFV